MIIIKMSAQSEIPFQREAANVKDKQLLVLKAVSGGAAVVILALSVLNLMSGSLPTFMVQLASFYLV